HGIQLTFKVTTNGTVMSATIIRLLEDFKMGIVISCDGTPNIQDQYRPSKSSISSSAMLEKAVGELMQQRANIPFIGVHCVYHTKEQSMTRSVDYFKSLGFDWYEFTPDVSNSSEDLTEAYLQSITELALHEFELGGISALCRIQNLNMVFSRLETQTPLRNHCGIGKSFMMMDAQGDFYLCPWMIGSASAKISTLQDESTAIFKDDLVDLHNCHSCWARNLCGGGCHFIHSKSKEKKDKSYCERVRGTMALAIHYFGQFQTQQ
ncbi:MAG: SPASM domain-containing protein, partial [Pseudobdellovibrionaceae bacterium]